MTGGFRFWARPATQSGCGRGSGCRSPRAIDAPGSTSRSTWPCWSTAWRRRCFAGCVQRFIVGGTARQHVGSGQPRGADRPDRPADLIGLRDKTIFLAARGEQYLPALVFFATLPFVDMIIALKLLIVIVWLWAGISKFGLHFSHVIPPMVSNSPTMPIKWLKRAHYRDYPRRPAALALATFMAHGPGTRRGDRLAADPAAVAVAVADLVAVAIMVCFHLFIISTFPLAVPLEWNALFGYAVVFLFLGLPQLAGLCDLGHVLALVDGADRGGLCSSRCWATSGPTWCRSCRRCGSTPGTGRRRCGRSRRAPRRS